MPQSTISSALSIGSFGTLSPSLRWLNLTHTLWSIVVQPANRLVTSTALEHLLEVMGWRIDGKVSASEFDTILETWMNRAASPVPNKRESLVLSQFRHILLEGEFGEPLLDIMIGMMLHEMNKTITGKPISYLPSSTSRHAKFEICTQKWQTLSNELFFLLDTPAHGILRFDEMFFFTAVLSLCTQDERERRWFSRSVVAAKCFQLFKDAGARVNIKFPFRHIPGRGANAANSSSNSSSSSSNSSRSSSSGGGNRLRSPSSSQCLPSSASLIVTVTMFQQLLLSRGIGETLLAALISHTRSAIVRLQNLAASVPEFGDTLLCSMSPLGRPSTLGSPRIWQHAVVVASGHELPIAASLSSVSTSPASSSVPAGDLILPGVVAFLLCDAERCLSARFLSSDEDLASCFPERVAALAATSHGPGVVGGGLSIATSRAFEELQQNAYRLMLAFKVWGAEPTAISPPQPLSSPPTSPIHGSTTASSPSTSTTRSTSPGRAKRDPTTAARPSSPSPVLALDPVFQMFIGVLLEFKRQQAVLILALSRLSISPSASTSVSSSSSPAPTPAPSSFSDGSQDAANAKAAASQLLSDGRAIQQEILSYDAQLSAHAIMQLKMMVATGPSSALHGAQGRQAAVLPAEVRAMLEAPTAAMGIGAGLGSGSSSVPGSWGKSARQGRPLQANNHKQMATSGSRSDGNNNSSAVSFPAKSVAQLSVVSGAATDSPSRSGLEPRSGSISPTRAAMRHSAAASRPPMARTASTSPSQNRSSKGNAGFDQRDNDGWVTVFDDASASGFFFDEPEAISSPPASSYPRTTPIKERATLNLSPNSSAAEAQLLARLAEAREDPVRAGALIDLLMQLRLEMAPPPPPPPPPASTGSLESKTPKPQLTPSSRLFDSPPTSPAAAVSTPNIGPQSISELSKTQTGYAVGAYAQLLRDLLRKVDTKSGEGLNEQDLRAVLALGRSMGTSQAGQARR